LGIQPMICDKIQCCPIKTKSSEIIREDDYDSDHGK